MDSGRVIAHIINWLKDYCIEAGQSGFVVGVSGGIDSAVTSALCARTGLPLVCVEMPIHQSPAQISRALEHIASLQRAHAHVRMERVQLTPVFDALMQALPAMADAETHQLAQANARARLRMTTLYYFAGMNQCLVAGTGNKVEDFGVGFYTKYGDGGVDLSPIADLTKTEVYELGSALGVIDSIMQAKPTDGLWGDDRSDEDQLGASYPELEWAMAFRDSGASASGLSDRQQVVLAIFDRRRAANSHKMEPIPVCVIPAALRN
ncbi:MAG: NAD(+) synthase [Flavobacteriales bacterium]|nr:NAD(+) synthase [Flavobacteriales bacterium]